MRSNRKTYEICLYKIIIVLYIICNNLKVLTLIVNNYIFNIFFSDSKTFSGLRGVAITKMSYKRSINSLTFSRCELKGYILKCLKKTYYTNGAFFSIPPLTKEIWKLNNTWVFKWSWSLTFMSFWLANNVHVYTSIPSGRMSLLRMVKKL